MTAAALLRSAAQLTQQRTRQRGRIWLVPDPLCLHAILSQNILHVASALPPSRLLLRAALVGLSRPPWPRPVMHVGCVSAAKPLI